MAPFSHATGRQRGEGNLPSGNKSATNAKRAFIGTHSQQVIQADTLPPGGDPPSTTSA